MLRRFLSISSWASSVLLLGGFIPIAQSGSLRFGQWQIVWLVGFLITFFVVRKELLPLVGAGWVCLVANSNILSWYNFRTLWLWCILVSILSTRIHRTKTFLAIRILCVIQIIIGFLQLAGIDPILHHTGRPIGLFDNTVSLACWFISTAPFLTKGYWLIAHTAMLTLILLLGSTAAVIFVCVTSLMAVVHKMNARTFLFGFAMACLFVLGYSLFFESIPTRLVNMQSERIAMWKMVVQHGFDRFQFLGHGLSSLQVDYRDWPVQITRSLDQIPWNTAHNDILQAWYEGGWVLILGWAAAFAAIARSVKTHVLRAALVGFVLCASYAYPWQVAPLWVFGVVLCSLAFKERDFHADPLHRL